MSHDSGRQNISLDDDEEAFLRRCTNSPADVEPAEIFELLDSEEDDERQLGGRALTQYSRAAPSRLEDHTEQVVGYLGDEDDNVRGSVIMVVKHLVEVDASMFSEPPVEPLIERLGKEDQPGSKRAAQTLVALLDEDDPRLTEAVDSTVDLFAGDKHEAGSAIQALSVLGDASPDPVIERLTDRLSDESADVRKYAVRTLATLSEDNPERVGRATEALLALLDEDDDYTLEHTLSTLVDVAKYGPGALESSIPTLTGLVDADDNDVRRGAVRILAELGRADVDIGDAVAELRGRLDDEDKIVRRDACYALGILRAEAALSDIESLTDHDDLELQAVAASCVERITDGESEPPMAELDPGEIFLARN